MGRTGRNPKNADRIRKKRLCRVLFNGFGEECVPPCSLRPCGRMNSDFPSACAPANGQTYSQVSNPYQKPGYVKRRQLAAPSYSVVISAPMTPSSPEQPYFTRSASTTSYLSPGLSFSRWSRNSSMLNVFFLSAPAVSL